MKEIKNLFLIVAIMVMCLSGAFSVYASEDDYVKPVHLEGKCGDDVYYTMDFTYSDKYTMSYLGHEFYDSAHMDLVIIGTGNSSTYDYDRGKDKYSPFHDALVTVPAVGLDVNVKVSGVRRLGNELFYELRLENDDFLKNVEEIGEGCFLGVRFINTETLIIPENITEIEENSFAHISLTGEDTTIIVRSKFKDMPGAFGNTYVKKIILPDSLETIGGGCFAFSTIESIKIPDSVTSIGGSAFFHSSVSSVELPPNLKKISAECFDSCKSLKSIKIPDTVEVIENSAFKYSGLSGRMTLPSSLKTLRDRAFVGCNGITEVVFPEGFSSIAEYTFGESGLKKAVFLGDEPLDYYTGEAILVDYQYFPSNTVVYYDPNKNWNIVNGRWLVYEAVAGIGSAANKKDFTAKVNGTGTAYAKYRVVDENGDPLKNKEITWSMYNAGIAHAPGSAPEAEPLITKTDTTDDDGYIVISKVLNDDESVKTVTGFRNQHKFEIFVYDGKSEDGDLTKLTMFPDTVTLEATATPVSFSQTWKGTMNTQLKASMGPGVDSGDIRLNLASLDGTLGRSPSLELTHEYSEGTRKLSLLESSQLEFSLGASLGLSAKYEEEGKKFGLAPACADGSIKSNALATYGIDINNYDPKNPDHVVKIGKMVLASAALTSGSTMLLRGVDALGMDIFTSYGYGNSFVASGGISLAEGTFNDHTYGAGRYEAKASYSETITNEKVSKKNTITHKKVVSDGWKIGNYADKHLVSEKGGLDAKAALFSTEDKHNEYTLSKVYEGSGTNGSLSFTNVLGYNNIDILGSNRLNKRDITYTYTNDEYKKFIKDYPRTLSLIYTDKPTHSYVFDTKIQELGENMGKSSALCTYKEIQTSEDSVAFPINFALGVSDGIFSVKGGISLSGADSVKYTVSTGEMKNGITYPQSQSSPDQLVKDNLIDPATILSEAAQTVAEMAAATFTKVVGRVKEGISNGKAIITSKYENAKNYFVTVRSTTGHSGGGHSSGGGAHAKLTSISRDLMINTYDLGMAELPTGGEDTPSSISSNDLFAGAATVIGESYYVTLSKDEAGTQVIEDFSTTPLTLTLGYNEDILKDAGMGLAAVPSLAIYEYCEAVKGYKVLESTADETAMTLTTQITHPGEYLLAVPYSAEQYKIVEQEYEASKENGSKENALSEMKIGDSGYVVKYTGSVSFNSLSHIWTESKESKTKCADITVKLFDPQGQEVAPSLFKLKFKNNKNVNTNGKKTPSFTITLKGKVDKNTKRAFKKNPVKFEITPAWIGYCPLDYKKIKETSKGVKVTNLYYTNIRLKKVKLKAMNKKMTKGDYTAELKDGKLLLRGYGNYRGEVLINPKPSGFSRWRRAMRSIVRHRRIACDSTKKEGSLVIPK